MSQVVCSSWESGCVGMCGGVRSDDCDPYVKLCLFYHRTKSAHELASALPSLPLERRRQQSVTE